MTTSTTTTLPLVAGRWAVDPAHSSVGFAVRHLGVSKVRGRFQRFDADVVVGPDLASTSVTATVDLASVDTGNPDRDAHVQAPDIIDVATRPTLAFRSMGVSGAGPDYVLHGEVTIGDVTRPIDLELELGGVEAFVDGTRHAGFEARGELRRTDFGIGADIPTVMLGDVIRIELDIQLVEPTPT